MEGNGFILAAREDLPVRPSAGAYVHPELGMRIEELLAKYRGFDSPSWPPEYDTDLAWELHPLSRLPELVAFWKEVSRVFKCDIAYLDPTLSDHRPTGLPQEFRFCGYDFGFFESPGAGYSSIVNEVIHGVYAEMRAYIRHLNSNLLLPTLDIAEELAKTRSARVKAGGEKEGGLETTTYTSFAPIAIYVYEG